MEKLVDSGKVRSIGVANFGIQNLETLLASARIVPAVCQLELNPLCSSTELVNFCQSKGIHVTAYSSLGAGSSPLAKDQTVRAIADAHGSTIQQVLLVWALKRGTSVIPKSITDSRIRSNYDLNRFDLTMEEMNKLSSLPAPF
jgi:glycerol 2-dehydrogenase (NADP+)